MPAPRPRRSHTKAADVRKIEKAISIRRPAGDVAAAEEHGRAMPRQIQGPGGGRDDFSTPILFSRIAILIDAVFIPLNREFISKEVKEELKIELTS